MEYETAISIMTTCPDCNNVYNYYDYLSHTQTCYILNNGQTNNSDMETNYDENEDNEYNEDHEDNEYNEEPLYQPLYAYNNSTYNGTNNYGNYIENGIITSSNLYNSMVHLNFNTNTNPTLNEIDILTTNLSSISINSDLYKENLFNNSRQEELTCVIECPICLCSYPKHTIFYILNCSHFFCIECCDKWFTYNSLCPLCKTNITNN